MTETVQQGILRLLKRGDNYTSSKLAENLNAALPAISIALGALYDKDLVHIADWRFSTQNRLMRIYAFGKGKDAKKPEEKVKKKIAIKPKAKLVHADVAAAWMFNPVRSR